jgi:CBS domain-containing protein
MTANPRGVSPGESIEECLFLMKEFNFRHLPVCEGKQLKGLISLRDVLLLNARQQTEPRRIAV